VAALLVATGVGHGSLCAGPDSLPPPPPSGWQAEPGAPAGQTARDQLKAARAQLDQGNFARAEELARQAEKMPGKFSGKEDTPAKVLEDVAAARTDPRALLKAARAALARKEYALAERHARQADKLSGVLTFPMWGDTPAKVLRDVKAARAAVAKPTAKPNTAPAATATAKPPAPAAKPAPAADDTEKVRALLKQARQALKADKLDEARRLHGQLAGLKTNLGWWEDNPNRLQVDINRAEARRAKLVQASAKAGEKAKTEEKPKAAPPARKVGKAEAVALLAEGRKQLAANKFDEAMKTGQRIKAMSGLSWRLFEDTPDALLRDVQQARSKHDRAESFKVLVEARRLYEKGDLDGATRAAYRAEKLHGPYSIFDLGDRPSKVLADIQVARARGRKTALPPPVLVKNSKSNPPTKADAPAGAGKPIAPPAPANNATVADARPPSNADGPARRASPLQQAPAQVMAANKVRAQQLLVEAQGYRLSKRYLDARNKATEAREVGAVYAADEFSPTLFLQQLALEVSQQVNALMQQAEEKAAHGPADEQARRKQAQELLAQARELATQFGQDADPVNQKIAWLRQLGSAPADRTLAGPAKSPDATASAPPAAATPAAPTQREQGLVLLEKGRMELRKGQTATARKMAEEAIKGNFGVVDEAMALLRSIDTEEFNQRRRQAFSAYDAAEQAFRRGDHRHASVLLGAIDTGLLDPGRQARLREIAMTPEMQPGQGRDRNKPGLARASDRTPVPNDAIVTTGASDGPAPAEGPEGKARVSDRGDDPLERTKAMRKIVFDKLRIEGLDAQREAAEKFRTGQQEDAIEVLQSYLARLGTQDLDDGQRKLLQRPVEQRLQNLRQLKAQADHAAGIASKHQTANDMIKTQLKAEELKQQNFNKAMKDFNDAFRAHKWAEAAKFAELAHEVDPDNSVATAAVQMAKTQTAQKEWDKIKQQKADTVLSGLNDGDNEGPTGEVLRNGGIAYDQQRWERVRDRKGFGPLQIGHLQEKERAIERKLSTPVSLNFKDTRLQQVLDDLADTNQINIVVDQPALQELGISTDSQISMRLDSVSLKSALNLILHQVHLTYVIGDEALQITTKERAQGKLRTVTYQVSDLVIPIESYGDLRAGDPTAPPPSGVQPPVPTPVASPASMPPGTPTGLPMGASASSSGSSSAPTPFNSPGNGAMTVTKSKPSQTNEEMLIKLITSTIAPRTWAEMGGPGTIEYFPMTMALVINQTPDIQEQVQDLLQALRRLQDQEVAIEVRFITIAEEFFERIGVNFNMNIVNQEDTAKFQPSLLANVFQPDARFLNIFDPSRFLSGLTPAGTLTPTLDIPITQNSFLQTVPQFGGYSAGGLTLGLAFLSDIQVFLFIEAAQGDRRTNIMQAPKITAFNGQAANITIADTQFFVTGVQVAQLGGGQFVFIPQNVQLPINNINLAVQPVISADRRFVRITLNPVLRAILPGPVNLIPIVVPIFTSFEGQASGQPVVFTQFLQQPRISTVNVTTTVAVPDGGTVLMGGLKRMSEERTEFGPPILSKIPYLNRLFKNTGYGRETESLLIMVTPRIIVQEEEEERQTGFRAPPLVTAP
jgi:type II secretory pathway component GspD/PulD (secretin)